MTAHIALTPPAVFPPRVHPGTLHPSPSSPKREIPSLVQILLPRGRHAHSFSLLHRGHIEYLVRFTTCQTPFFFFPRYLDIQGPVSCSGKDSLLSPELTLPKNLFLDLENEAVKVFLYPGRPKGRAVRVELYLC